MKPTDGDLIGRALEGSQEAYRDLIRRYERPVLSLILRMVRDRALAEDLAQDSFVKAIGALDRFDRRRKFSSWMLKIAHNTTIDHLRRKRLSTVPLETPEEESMDPLDRLPQESAPSPELNIQRRGLAEAILAALDELRPEYREVLVLRFENDLAYDEIAEITGLPLGTVKTHIFRARKALARRLERRGWAPGGS